MSEELRVCPACGALPCDWTENPFASRPGEDALVEDRDLTRLYAKFSQAADFTTEQDKRIHDRLRQALSTTLSGGRASISPGATS